MIRVLNRDLRDVRFPKKDIHWMSLCQSLCPSLSLPHRVVVRMMEVVVVMVCIILKPLQERQDRNITLKKAVQVWIRFMLCIGLFFSYHSLEPDQVACLPDQAGYS